ncbi:MAG: hypothetical protein U0228_28430 [Myxococcaceae bacterium]
MKALNLVLAGLVVCSSVAFAQDPLPSVAPAPLEFKRTPSGFPKKDREELLKIFPMLLRASDAMVPDGAKLTSALADLKRQDCEREDECLKQLARLAGTLYAIYVNVDYTLDKHVVVTGRVVRDDGVMMGGLQTVDIVKEAAFKDVARDGINQLLGKLAISKLPPFRPVAVVVADPNKKDPDPTLDPNKKKDPDPILPPPPPPPVDRSQADLGLGLVVAGGGVVVVSAVLASVGCGLGCGVATDLGSVPQSKLGDFNTARTLAPIGLVGLGVGAATAVVGAVLLATAPKPAGTVELKSVGVAPVAGGVAFSVGGAF